MDPFGMWPQKDVGYRTLFELLRREVTRRQLDHFFGSSLILSQCSCYMPRLSLTLAVFPMFQRLVLPFRLFLKIFLGLFIACSHLSAKVTGPFHFPCSDMTSAF